MRRRVLGYAAAGVLAVLTIGACSSGSGSGSAADKAAAGGSAVGATERKGAAPSAAPAGQPAPVNDTQPLAVEAKIRTAQMTVAVRGSGKVADAAETAARITAGVGGEVDSDDRLSGPQASAVLRLRVPPADLRAVLDQLAQLGEEKNRQLSTTDVSERVADVNSRVASAQEAIARLRTLYSSATKVGEIIAVESELSTREADLEALEAQQRTLARQTSMATITLTLQTAPKAAAAPAKKSSGFLGGLERGWDGFTAAAAWTATAVGTVLPFLVLLLVLAVVARLLGARLPRRGTPPPTPTPAE